MSGDLKSLFGQGRLLLDGRPAPENFVPPDRLTADAVEFRFAVDADGRWGKPQSINIVGLRHAE
jgi:hypothetical protein